LAKTILSAALHRSVAMGVFDTIPPTSETSLCDEYVSPRWVTAFFCHDGVAAVGCRLSFRRVRVAANRRLHTRWAGFDARHKSPVIANVAIARELAGWCWSLAIMPD